MSLILFLMLLLECAAVTGQRRYFYVRVGDNVTLPCNQQTGDRPTWNFVGAASDFVMRSGILNDTASSRADRLKLTEMGSLDIQKVQVEDAGFYDCQNNGRQSEFVRRHLSVVTMTEEQRGNVVTLRCSVTIFGTSCPTSVKWLPAVVGVIDGDSGLQTSSFPCGANLTFKSSHRLFDELRFSTCKVTDDRDVNRQPITFSFQSTVEKPGEEPPLQTEPRPGPGAPPGTEADPGAGADVRGCGAVDMAMLLLHVAEVLLLTVVMLLLLRGEVRR